MKTKIILLALTIISIFGCENKKKSSSKLTKISPSENIHSHFILDSSANSNAEYSSEQLDNTKGLSNSSINTIFQDSQNLLWIGTWDGLNRYDGANFTVYNHNIDKIENSIGSNVILSIKEDQKNKFQIFR